MNTQIDHSITSDRLILKPVTTDDISIYQEILSTDELTKYLPKGSAYTPDEIQHHLDNRVKHWQNYGFGSYVIFSQDAPNHGIGYAGVEVCPNDNCIDIRYAMSPIAQGKGYVFEASQAVLEKTFSHLQILGLSDKYRKIYGVSLPDNHTSVHLLKKLGMQADVGNPYDMDELVVMSIFG